jgi:hypothetical protein
MKKYQDVWAVGESNFCFGKVPLMAGNPTFPTKPFLAQVK